MASGSGLDLAACLLYNPDEIYSAALHLGFLLCRMDVALIIPELLCRAVIQIVIEVRSRKKAR